MSIASLVAVQIGGRVWIHSLTFSCGVRSFTFTDLGSLPGDFSCSMKGWQGTFILFSVALPPKRKKIMQAAAVRKCFSQEYGLLLCTWRDREAPATSLAAPPPQCKMVCRYHYSFNVSWHKTSRWVLALSWREVCWEGQGPSHTIVLQHLFCHGCVACPLAGWVGEDLGDGGMARHFHIVSSLSTTPIYDIWSGVLKRCSSPMKSQEDSQEVGCGVDWLSTMRATEEPFRWQWEWAWSDFN